MNDKLKQSLEGRLNGMRWGEREQAEVFRQIQRKELQDVKHVKRGTGMLAIAMAVLFLVMGAAFALDQLPQPEDTTLLTQPSGTEFVPVPAAKLENDYITLTVSNASWDGENVAFDALIRLKEPEKYALTIGNYTNPGSTSREKLRITLRGECEMDPQNGHQSFFIIDSPEVIDMTTDSATVRLTGRDVWLSKDTAEVTLTVAGSADDSLFTEETAFIIARETIGSAENENRRLWLFENELVIGYNAGVSVEGERFTLHVDVVPKKSWYVINASEPGKSTLNVNTEWAIGYGDDTILRQTSPTKLEYTQIEDGVRITAVFPYPSEHQSIRLMGHVYARDALIRSQFESLINMKSTRPTSATAEAASPTPTAAPEPTPTPTPLPLPESKAERSDPKGEHIGGNDLVSIFLEEGWFDGFTAEATLRIRVDDGIAARLTTIPNELGIPDESTWVVQLNMDEDDYSLQNNLEYTLSRDSYGDILLHIDYCDPHNSGHSSPTVIDNVDQFDLDLPISITNERTWEKLDASMTLRIDRVCELEPQPLYCHESTVEDLYLQGAVVTTDRYHYIGVMLPAENRAHIVRGHLLDENGETLATGRYTGTNGNSLTIFPRVLFPYDGDLNANFYLVVIRVDGSMELPELLPIRIEKYAGKNDYEPLADLLLSTTPPRESEQPQQVSIVLDANVLFDNEYMTVTFVDADYGHGHAMAELRAELKEPGKYNFFENNMEPEAITLDMELNFRASENQDSTDFAVMEMRDDSTVSHIYIHGSSDRWLDSAAPLITASLSLTQREDTATTSFNQTVAFTFPNMGHIERYDLAATDAVDAEHFTYVSGQLVSTEYLRCFQIQYRCSDPYEAAIIRLSCPASPLCELLSVNNQKGSSSDSTLKQSTVYCYPEWHDFSGEFIVTAKDLFSSTSLATFSVEAVPTDDTP